MHSTIFAARDHKSTVDLVDVAGSLARAYNLDPALVDALTITERAAPEVKALYQREAVVKLLTALAEAVFAGGGAFAPTTKLVKTKRVKPVKVTEPEAEGG